MAGYNGKGRDRGNGLPITGIPSSATTCPDKQATVPVADRGGARTAYLRNYNVKALTHRGGCQGAKSGEIRLRQKLLARVEHRRRGSPPPWAMNPPSVVRAISNPSDAVIGTSNGERPAPRRADLYKCSPALYLDQDI